MMRLIGVELTRLRLRRAVLVLLLLAVAVLVLIAASTIWDGRPVSEADRIAAGQMAEQDLAAAEEQAALCAQSPSEWGIPAGAGAAQECYDLMVGSPDLFTADSYLWRTPLDLAEERGDAALAAIVILAMLLLLVGATFAGADWSSGSTSVQLLIEPRRLRVWAAKAIALGLLAAGVVAAVVTGFWGLLAGFAALWDRPTSAEAWQEIVGTSALGVALGCGAAVTAYALTMLLRSTVGTLGVVVVGSIGTVLLPAVLPVDGPDRWTLPANVTAFVLGRFEYYDAAECNERAGESCLSVLERGPASVYLAVIVLVIAAASAWSFRRRDVP